MRVCTDFLNEPLHPLKGGPALETMPPLLCSAGLSSSTAAARLWYCGLCSHLARNSLHHSGLGREESTAKSRGGKEAGRKRVQLSK